MNESRTERVSTEKEIFFAALEQPHAEARAAFLDGACGRNPDLRRRVEGLLGDHFEAGSLLDNAAGDGPPSEPDEARVVEGPGTTIDRYKMLQRIGEGGFGVVYMAEQKVPVKRRVALKIIKLGMDTKQVVARFEAERQALAMMDHPNIARVLDAGETETGRPYFVMELVKGVPITRYCDGNNLTTRERLELFIPVCQAIQHAHQKGIIHRDIKPSNVMVTLHDGVPVPKVIDFGIAKATQQELTEKTLFTHYSQFIGTPAYMSPEQAEMSGLDIDTRTDIYSLGVLLYELLVGKTPLDGKELMSGGYDEIRRRIKEQEPSKPSIRLSTVEGAERTTIAKQRGIGANQLSHELRGDLDWIVLKALEKDRSRRYETANGFVLDLRRFLADEPVSAVAPSVIYKFRKFARRNKLALGAATAIAVSLVGGLGIALFSYVGERQARAEADEARNLADHRSREAEEARQAAERNKETAVAAQKAEELLKDEFRKDAYQADMDLASQAYQAGDLERMNELVEKHWPESPDHDLRGFEWYHWWLAGRLDLETRWGGPYRGLAVSRSGGMYAVSGWPNWLAVISRDDKELARIPIPNEWSPFAFTPDGGELLIGDRGSGHVQVYETASWTSRALVVPGNGGVHSFGFSPTQEVMATGGAAGQVVLWDMRTWEPLGAPMETHDMVWDLEFSRDGKDLLAAMENSIVVVFDVEARTIRTTLTGHGNSVSSVAHSPVADFFVTGSEDKTVRLWNENYELAGAYDAYGKVMDVRFSEDGRQLIASTSGSNSVLVWDVRTASLELELAHEIKGHSRRVMAADFSLEDNEIMSVSDDASAKRWDLDRCEPYETVEGAADAIQLDFSEDGKELLILDALGTVHQRNIASGRLAESIHRAGEFHPRYLSSYGRFQAGSTPDGRIGVRAREEEPPEVLWDAIGDPGKPGENRNGLRVSGDGHTAVWAGAGGINVWERDKQSKRKISCSLDGILAISANGDRVATHQFAVTSVWNLAEDPAVRLWSADGWGPEMCAQFSPDGRWIAIGSYNNDIRIHDAATGTRIHALKGHRSAVLGLDFSPDGTRMVSCADDEQVCLWDPGTGRLLSTFKGFPDRPESIAWSPDGISFALLSSKGGVRIWNRAPEAEVDRDGK